MYFSVLLSLDEAIASRAVVFIIVSGSDGLADGRKRLWSQLINSKTGKGYIICINWKLIGTHGRAIKWAYPRHLHPYVLPNPLSMW